MGSVIKKPAISRRGIGLVNVAKWNAATLRLHRESEPVNCGFRHELCRVRRSVENLSAGLQHRAVYSQHPSKRRRPNVKQRRPTGFLLYRKPNV